ncbi:MAG: DUF1848 domain-containing protein [Deltaproteobacteria bacterium]|jgi:hypothetical protein|nr:DUF1848 domain-containing protein [Deltaproteobacteria bacterium]
MIISASRRTDIPAFYSEWLINRLRAGEVLYPNPWNPKRFYRVALAPGHVDCIVFWTKNPGPMLERLGALDELGYNYYFSFTITAYGQDLEPGLPRKAEVLDTFLRLAERLGPRRVDWRFDPVAISAARPLDWHLERFRFICERLGGATERCIVNFIKSYRHIARRLALVPGMAAEMDGPAIRAAVLAFQALAAEYALPLYTCTEREELRDLPVKGCACIDKEKIAAITGSALKIKKDSGQPKNCNCVESADIGMYGTCAHGCVYCYANGSEDALRRRIAGHRSESPVLTGRPDVRTVIAERTRPSHKETQLKLC